jgi:hypothetical protein
VAGDGRRGFFGTRSVQVWTVIGGIAAVTAVFVSLLTGSGDGDPAGSGSTSTTASAPGTAQFPPTAPRTSLAQPEAPPAFTKDLTVPLFGSYASIYLAQGDVECCHGASDLYYGKENGQLYIRTPSGKISEDVERPSKAGCLDALSSRPTAGPITDLTSGKEFCASSSEGVALLTILAPPDAEDSLQLRLTFWNN